MGKMSTKFDFLKHMNETNPQAFQDYTQEVLEEYFNSLPDDRQQRARQLQWNLDNELRHYKDPIARMNKMVEIFYEGLDEFNEVMQGVSNVEITDG